MYKLINEDNTLVKDYPSPRIYKTLSDEEKKNIFTFKKEIEKITLEKGLGRVSVNIFYDGPSYEIEFMIKHSKNFTEEYFENERIKIYQHLRTFSKKNNMYKFYLGCHILLEK